MLNKVESNDQNIMSECSAARCVEVKLPAGKAANQANFRRHLGRHLRRGGSNNASWRISMGFRF
jgi:hypothetical protein